jgi:hypothetical protein
MAVPISSLEDVLRRADSLIADCWLFLPADQQWTSETWAAVAPTDQVTAEQEKRDGVWAGTPMELRQLNLRPTLLIADVQDVKSNRISQLRFAGRSTEVTTADHFAALLHYWKYDAYAPV